MKNMSQNLLEKLRTYIEFDQAEQQFIGNVFKLRLLQRANIYCWREMCVERRLLLKPSLQCK